MQNLIHFTLAQIFRRFDLPFTEEFTATTLSDVATRIRGSLKSRTKILKGLTGLTHAASLEILAKALGFQDWHECNKVIAGLEGDNSSLKGENIRLPDIPQMNSLLSTLVQWAPPAPELGDQDPAKLAANGMLMTHIVIAHAHGHARASCLPSTLEKGLEISARLHGAPSWSDCVYSVPYWADMAKGGPTRSRA